MALPFTRSKQNTVAGLGEIATVALITHRVRSVIQISVVELFAISGPNPQHSSRQEASGPFTAGAVIPEVSPFSEARRTFCSSLFLRVIGRAFELAGERTGIRRREDDGRVNLEAGRQRPNDEAGMKTAKHLRASGDIPAAANERSFAVGHPVGENQNGRGREGEEVTGHEPTSLHTETGARARTLLRCQLLIVSSPQAIREPARGTTSDRRSR